MGDDVAGRGVDPASGAVRLMAGSIEWPDLANWLALRLFANRLGGRWYGLGSPGALPRIPAGTTVLFLVDSIVLNSLRSASVTCKVKRA